jgi:hypothetical protein
MNTVKTALISNWNKMANMFLQIYFVEETGKWETPIEYPTDGKLYKWNEEIINWIEVITE